MRNSRACFSTLLCNSDTLLTCFLPAIWQVANKFGETIYKGHRSYDLMLNLQLGIRHSVQQVAREPVLDTVVPDGYFKQKVCCTPGFFQMTQLRSICNLLSDIEDLVC